MDIQIEKIYPTYSK